MHVLLVGGGGREAALAYRIARSRTLTSLTVTADNPSWPDGVRHHHVEGSDAVVAAARQLGVDLVVVGPEGPLAAGLADALRAAGVACFGPERGGARLEASKAFAKEIMAAAGVQTAASVIVDRDDPDSVARGRARCAAGNVVVKADGLAAGKGVVVCEGPAQALAAFDEIARFGEAAKIVVLEDRLTGPEVSVFALCDGERVAVLPSAQDHKQLLDGGRGPNTGGMGAYVPCALMPAAEAQALAERVHLPVIRELAARGTPYRGVLYAGIMCTPDGPRVLEFNVRFGDPECQPLMALWDDDILPWLHGAATGALPEGRPRFADASACCVVLASAGYPAGSDRGREIPEPSDTPGVVVFQAGSQRDAAGVLRTAGGRVLGITGVAPELEAARAVAYEAVEGWRFEGCQFRTDIGPGAVR